MICRRIISLLIRKQSTNVKVVESLGPDSREAIGNEEIRHDQLKQIEDDAESSDTNRKIKKGKFAILLSYHGANYQGMQFTTFGESIESHFFEALVKAGLATTKETRNPRFKLSFNRTSRTDRGVSALRQVVGMNLPLDTDIQQLNEYLPADIRVLGIKRTIRSFDPQKHCDSRSYCYIMPTFALCPRSSACESRINYRIPAETLCKANEIFKTFEGVHKFHNYTTKRDPWDDRARRKVLEISLNEPFLCNGLELVELNLRGTSFMLHQIRRMVGMTIALMQGRAPSHFLGQSFEPHQLSTPTAPALGLVLENQHFEGYNKQFSRDRPPLEWSEFDDEVTKFKQEKIVPYIVMSELQEKHMIDFLDTVLRIHSYFPNRDRNIKPVELGNWEDLELVDKLLADETIRKD